MTPLRYEVSSLGLYPTFPIHLQTPGPLLFQPTIVWEMVPMVSCFGFFSSECKWEVCYGCLYFTFMMKPWWHTFQSMWSTMDPLDIIVTNNLDRFVWKMGSNAWEWIFCTLNSYKLLKTTNFLKQMFSKMICMHNMLYVIDSLFLHLW